MGRSIRIATVVAILACTTPGWGQVQTKDRIITVKENGKDSVQCKVLKTWKEKDGSTVSQVQSLVTGEKFTIVDGAATPASPDGPAPSRMRIFNWSKKDASPAGVSASPTTVVSTTEPPLQGTTTRTSAPVIVKQIPTKVVTEEPVVAPKGRPGLLSNVFGKSQPTTTTTTTPAAVTGRETKSPAIQRTGGTVTSGDGSRSALPISTNPRQVDPIDFPDQYGSGPAISTVPTSPSKLPTAQKSGDIKLTSGSPTTVPTKPRVDILPAPGTKPVTTVSATSVTTAATTTTECTACKSAPAKAGCSTCSTCATASATQPQRYGLLSRLRKSEPAETVVVQGSPTVVPGVPTNAVASCATCSPVEKVKAVKSVRMPTVKEERVVAHLPLPRNEGRIGAFSGMRSGKPRTTSGPHLGNSDLPAGMSSVSAAGSPGVSEDTPVGAIVRTPDGQTMMVPYNQVASNMPAVPVNAPNAFSLSSPGVAMYTVNPDNVANAFGMAMPTRPVPADHGLSPNVPNAWAAMPGVPGEPRAYPGQGYPVAMNYPTQPVGYYPPQGYYPVPQPMVHPGVMMPRGSAVASDMTPGSAPYLAALRLNVMPSERERAVEGLTRCNWKADPQVVPALVMAAQTDPSPTVRVSCIRALGHMKANSAPTVEALQQMKEDRDPRVRLEVQQVLPLLMKP
ncbi:MAG: HEAT repeat domain-containing protein [Gemmataceae bacterium]